MVAGLTYAGNSTLTECMRHQEGTEMKGLNGVVARKLTESCG